MFYSRRWPFPSSTIIQIQESMKIMANWIVLFATHLSPMANPILIVSCILLQMVLQRGRYENKGNEGNPNCAIDPSGTPSDWRLYVKDVSVCDTSCCNVSFGRSNMDELPIEYIMCPASPPPEPPLGLGPDHKMANPSVRCAVKHHLS